MHWLRGEASPEGRRLLRVLLIWFGTLSTNPGRAFRRDRSGFLLRGLRRGQRFRPIVTRLAWQCPYQRVGMVGASRSHACCVVSRRAGSRRRLDGYAHLDGFGLHLKCETVRTHALPPYYLTMIVPVIALGIISSGSYVWIARWVSSSLAEVS